VRHRRGWFDLDDVGAEIRKQFAAIRQRIAAADLHDAQFLEWQFRHFHSLSVDRAIMSMPPGTSSHPGIADERGGDLPSVVAIAEISGFMKKASFAG
jgi:hypothetical protein